MRFFTDPTPFTHYGSIYSIPAYITDPDGDMKIAGTNVIYDWLLLWVPEMTQFILSLLSEEHAQGFAIRIDGELK